LHPQGSRAAADAAGADGMIAVYVLAAIGMGVILFGRKL
jgi:hypothetical protein